MSLAFFTITFLCAAAALVGAGERFGESVKRLLSGASALPVALGLSLLIAIPVGLLFGEVLAGMAGSAVAWAAFLLTALPLLIWGLVAAFRAPTSAGDTAAETADTADTEGLGTPPTARPQKSTAAAAEPQPKRAAPSPKVPEPPRPKADTVTAKVLERAIAFEDRSRRMYQQLVDQSLPEEVINLFLTLGEEKDDHAARLRAAMVRHQGEEVLRLHPAQIPEFQFPDFSHEESAIEIQELVKRQEDVALEFYREVAKHSRKTSLKNLFASLALDGQRHMSLVSHIIDVE